MNENEIQLGRERLRIAQAAINACDDPGTADTDRITAISTATQAVLWVVAAMLREARRWSGGGGVHELRAPR